MRELREISVFLFDLDGTLNMGERPLDGAMETLRLLSERGKRVCFVTNNSSKSRLDYLSKVRRMGYDATIGQIITSGTVAARHMARRHPGARIFLLGTETLANELKGAGLDIVGPDSAADALLLAFDTELTYAKLWRASNLVAGGAAYVATHPDIVCPSDDGNMPDAGALIALLEKTAGRLPDAIVGKPFRPMAEYVFDAFGAKPEDVAFVGDRLYTDIKFATDNGMTSVLVLSGETTAETLRESGATPDFVFGDVNELRNRL